MPSIAATTDAAMKIASVNPAFASTDVFFEMVGFDQATISRVNSQMRMNQARANVASQPILMNREAAQMPQRTDEQQQATKPASVSGGDVGAD